GLGFGRGQGGDGGWVLRHVDGCGCPAASRGDGRRVVVDVGDRDGNGLGVGVGAVRHLHLHVVDVVAAGIGGSLGVRRRDERQRARSGERGVGRGIRPPGEGGGEQRGGRGTARRHPGGRGRV